MKILPKTLDYELLKQALPQETLVDMDKVLQAYQKNKIKMTVRRDEDGSCYFKFKIPNKFKRTNKIYIPTLIKWYEDFEDTEYLIAGMQD